MFENTQASGRVDLVRTGNTVKATTRGVAEFTLLLSPDVFDFSKPVRVETNGQRGVRGDGATERRDAREVGGARQRPHDAVRRGAPRQGSVVQVLPARARTLPCGLWTRRVRSTIIG